MSRHKVCQDIHGPEVRRGAEQGAGTGGLEGAVRPRLGLEDKIWEAKGRKACAVTRGSVGNKGSGVVRKSWFKDPGVGWGMGVHSYQNGS